MGLVGVLISQMAERVGRARTNLIRRCERNTFRPGGITMRLALCLIVLASLGGCGVVALPFRVTGDVVQAVPVIGKPIGKPIHAVGDAID
jgi:hypothetical protein